MPEAAPAKRWGDNRLKIKTTLENTKPGDSFPIASQHLVGQVKCVAAAIDVRVTVPVR